MRLEAEGMRIMEIIYKGCLCIYGTYCVMGENKPAFFLKECSSNVNPFELGFDEVHYGVWCHILNKEENAKMAAYLDKIR